MLNNYSKFKYMISYYFQKKNLSKLFHLRAARALHVQPKLVNIKVFVHVFYSTNENIPHQLPCYCIATNFHVYFAITTIYIYIYIYIIGEAEKISN